MARRLPKREDMGTIVYKSGGFYKNAKADIKKPELYIEGTHGPIVPKIKLPDGKYVHHDSVKERHFVQEFDPFSFDPVVDEEEKKRKEDVPAYKLKLLPAAAADKQKIVYLTYYVNNITSTTIRAGDDSLRYFITDNLSGCKVYIDRRENGDLVCYHANAKHKPEGEAQSTMDTMHRNAQQPRDVNVASLSKDVYYKKVLEKEKQTGRRLSAGTTVMGFRADNGQWEFWYQTYGRVKPQTTEREPGTSFLGKVAGKVAGKDKGKGKEGDLGKVPYEIVESGRFWPLR